MSKKPPFIKVTDLGYSGLGTILLDPSSVIAVRFNGFWPTDRDENKCEQYVYLSTGRTLCVTIDDLFRLFDKEELKKLLGESV